MIYTTDIVGDQAVLLFHSLLLGAALGACYELFRFGKLFFPKKPAIRVGIDLLFCLWTGFLTFSFFLNENYGMPRMYLYGGVAAGFLAWYLTLGKIFFFLEKTVLKILSTVLSWVFRPVRKLFRKLSPYFKNISKKALFYPEKLLKKPKTMMYNILCLNGRKSGSDCGGAGRKEHPDLESAGNEKEREGPFYSDRSYCLRHLPSVFSDRHAGEHHG